MSAESADHMLLTGWVVKTLVLPPLTSNQSWTRQTLKWRASLKGLFALPAFAVENCPCLKTVPTLTAFQSLSSLWNVWGKWRIIYGNYRGERNPGATESTYQNIHDRWMLRLCLKSTSEGLSEVTHSIVKHHTIRNFFLMFIWNVISYHFNSLLCSYPLKLQQTSLLSPQWQLFGYLKMAIISHLSFY